jgi:hypothetical protein
VRKILIATVLGLLFAFLSLKNDVNVSSKAISRKTSDPDPHQNVMDPED